MRLKKNLIIQFYFIFICVLITGCTMLVRPQIGQLKSIILSNNTSSNTDDIWDVIREGFQIPNLNNNLSKQWTQYYKEHPESIRRIAERSVKYLYFVVNEINNRGLPTELALMPFIESAYDPSAISKNKASGLWQFVPRTAKHFNLKQNWWLDERRDPIISTYAALDYLESLYKRQGDWHLALASYNCGESVVQKAIEKNKKSNKSTKYINLQLPKETTNYVPKLQAVKNIITNPQKYGIDLPRVENKPYFQTVKKNRDIDIEVAAKLAEISLEEFKALNPSHNRPVISSKHSQTILLPAKNIDKFHINLKKFTDNLSNWKIYKSKDGETFFSIAKKFGVSEIKLKKINNIRTQQKTASGQLLLIEQKNVISSNKKTYDYLVLPGDNLSKIAKKHNTTVKEIRYLNRLKDDRIKHGKKIKLPCKG
ncbi:MAG: transglycosylase SLT domain-containing protein [Candidatus Kinetoplastibacterium crithidii]|nr:MAG: transglycosylase SLT domain-containing protein [Candidatus Kinetoplastibacterium crithidii]